MGNKQTTPRDPKTGPRAVNLEKQGLKVLDERRLACELIHRRKHLGRQREVMG
jgi:hypothetical protein